MNNWMFLFILFYQAAHAQFSGSRITGMGNYAASLPDPWNILFNPASITNVSHTYFSAGHRQSLFSEEITSQAALFIQPFKNNYAGAGIQKYGNREYHELTAYLSFVKKFSSLSIGIGIHYGQIAIQGYGKTTGTFFSVGACYEINETLSAAIGGINPFNQQYNTSISCLRTPALYAGMAYTPSPQVVLSSTILRENNQWNLAAGLEYKMIKQLSLRGGLHTFPFKQFGGIGYQVKRMEINIAFSRDIQLGYVPQIDIGYAF